MLQAVGGCTVNLSNLCTVKATSCFRHKAKPSALWSGCQHTLYFIGEALLRHLQRYSNILEFDPRTMNSDILNLALRSLSTREWTMPPESILKQSVTPYLIGWNSDAGTLFHVSIMYD